MAPAEHVDERPKGVHHFRRVGPAVCVRSQLHGMSAHGDEQPVTLVQLVLAIYVQHPLSAVSSSNKK